MSTVMYLGYGDPVKFIQHFEGWTVLRVDVRDLAEEKRRADAVYATTLNELACYQVPQAIEHCHRLLTDDGFLVLASPALETAFEALAAPDPNAADVKKAMNTIYGPASVDKAHSAQYRCGFTRPLIRAMMRNSPFGNHMTALGKALLCTAAYKRPASNEELEALLHQLLGTHQARK
jgi:hypothetical protein